MARNKYPEVTVERILDAAQRLFLEKCYDNTTIQDIVDELGGLTKGAVYHHFKSKEEILDAVWGKDYIGELKIVDVNIRRLRIKLEDDPQNPTYINTVWGFGYKWGC